MTADPADLRDLYLDLLKRALQGHTMGKMKLYRPVEGRDRVRAWAVRMLRRRGGSVLAAPVEVDPADNREGDINVLFLPPGVMTMIGTKRMDNLHECMARVLADGVPGDFIETGVWKGGATILMRGVLRAYGVSDRKVFVADSFAGLPAPDLANYPEDAGLDFHLFSELAISREEVMENFRCYGMLDDQVEFVKGWFRDSLPGLRDHTWALIRLDGDLYESTMDSFTNLYPGLSPGGFVIIDDYEIPACVRAVSDYRQRNGITDPIVPIDGHGVYWQRSP